MSVVGPASAILADDGRGFMCLLETFRPVGLASGGLACPDVVSKMGPSRMRLDKSCVLSAEPALGRALHMVGLR